MKYLITFVALCIHCAAPTSIVEAAFNKWITEKDCSEITDVKSNFNVSAFQGKWYNIERYGHPLAKKSNCSTVEYVSVLKDGSYSLVTDGVNLDTGEQVETKFSAVLSNSNAEPLIGQFNISVFELERVNYILDTDYTSYAVSYDCQPISEKRSQHLYWLLSRTPTLTKDTKVLARIAELKVKYVDETLVEAVVMDPKLCPIDE